MAGRTGTGRKMRIDEKIEKTWKMPSELLFAVGNTIRTRLII